MNPIGRNTGAIVVGMVWALACAHAQKELISPGTILCSSDNGQRRYCRADTRRGVRLIRQVRGLGCRPATWGYDARGVWVDRGCQAEFDLSGGTGTESGPMKTITAGCGADRGRERDRAGQAGKVQARKQAELSAVGLRGRGNVPNERR
jgi:hypothetical protein